MSEKTCSKCDKPITGKNFRASDGKVVHKICPTKSIDKTPKQGISVKRIENATSLIKFLDELGVDDREKRKVMSRAYGMISKNLK